MKVFQENDQAFLDIDKDQVERLVLFVCEKIPLSGDEIYVNFVTKERMCELHSIHFDDPSPTDCITFPIDGHKTDKKEADDPPHVIGEVFVCPKVAHEVEPQDPHKELSLYIVHTLLHLAGYNDLEEDDIAEMRHAESEMISALEEKNLLLSIPNLLIN